MLPSPYLLAAAVVAVALAIYFFSRKGACAADGDCAAGTRCVAGACAAAPPGSCVADGDCASGTRCVSGACVGGVLPPAPPQTCAADGDCPQPGYCRDDKVCRLKQPANAACLSSLDCIPPGGCVGAGINHEGTCVLPLPPPATPPDGIKVYNPAVPDGSGTYRLSSEPGAAGFPVYRLENTTWVLYADRNLDNWRLCDKPVDAPCCLGGSQCQRGPFLKDSNLPTVGAWSGGVTMEAA